LRDKNAQTEKEKRKGKRRQAQTDVRKNVNLSKRKPNR